MADSYGETENTALLNFMGTLHGTVLDLGCGRGSWAPRLRALGARRIIGLEPSADAELARDKYDQVVRLPIEQVESLPCVDIIIAADVLEHLVDPWDVLAKLRRAAGHNGRIYCSVPNMQYIKSLWTIARGDFPYTAGGFWDRTHLRWFTAGSLTSALAEAGWRVDRTEYVVGAGMRRRLHRLHDGLAPFLGHQFHVSAAVVP